MSDADIALNDKLKQEEIERLNLAGGEGDEEAGFESLLPEDKNFLLKCFQYAKKNAKQVKNHLTKKTKKKSKK